MINLFNVPISITSKSQALATISRWMTESKGKREERRGDFPKLITTPNPEMIVSAQKDPEFLKALQSADLAIPDGVGVIWALKILGLKRPGLLSEGLALKNISRLSGTELMELLIEESTKKGWKVMLLGGCPGIAEKAAKKLMHQIRPGLAKQGRAFIQSINGPQDISNIPRSENDNLISGINSFSPDLLFVAFGHGQQEKWLNANRKRLNVGVAMGVGGALDQIVDPSLRPPSYINSIGLGWLYRLFRQPWRIKRQLALIRFVGMVIKDRILEGRR